MTTREELIDGFQMIIREGLRTTANLGPDDWKAVVHDEDGGWNVKQVYCHLTAIAEVTPGLLGALSQTAEGEDAGASLDIDSFNAQNVASRESMSEPELMEAFKASHEKLIEFLRDVPDEQLQQRRRFGPVEGTVAEIMATILVLHDLSHIYHAADRPTS